MAALVFDPPGQELFEHWHYEIFHLEDRAGLPAAVPDMHDSGGRDGPSFYDLQGTMLVMSSFKMSPVSENVLQHKTCQTCRRHVI